MQGITTVTNQGKIDQRVEEGGSLKHFAQPQSTEVPFIFKKRLS